ncbi:helix-hairpin-helix domain-containing protein [Blautia wexlerae]|uniref:helix-hairpin-helix domain-containing protein n=1 Tax=Blautia wexlerae TaxID=418240 RepID=UPI001D0E4BDF|nr:helix-hairpin-helix domain-containing protein [Blautia wexlerae]MCC2180346.1 helix-hairpin-helix domain-containing protein [Blautia wexlerae]
MIKIKNRCCYTVTLILCGTLFLTGLTGCKSREAQFLIDGLQEAKAEVDAESLEEKTSGQKSKKDTDEKKADTEDRQNDDGSSAESWKKQAESDGSDAGNGTEINSTGETQPEMIYVDVCGAVANPGVFQLAVGSRVFQAIEAAGGYLPEAVQNCVNRAGVLTDGQQLYILTQEEMERQGLDPAEMAGASDGQMNGSAGTGQNAGLTVQAQQDNRININTADEAQLTTLTGIGATRAQAIISYRQENGPFAVIEDIMNVQGIKEGTFAKIKDEIVVG